jgi:hypothetical protein
MNDTSQKKLDLEILDLEHKIDRDLLEREETVSEKTKELRQKILHIHSLVENNLDFKMAIKLYLNSVQNLNLDFGKGFNKAFIVYLRLFMGITEKLTFVSKLRLSKDMKIIDGSTHNLYDKLNQIRNALAHDKKHKINLYETSEARRDALKIGSDVLDLLKVEGKESMTQLKERLIEKVPEDPKE